MVLYLGVGAQAAIAESRDSAFERINTIPTVTKSAVVHSYQ
jgi:hypothetical protein